ncbi:MAG: flippase-like domain-containing protein [Bacteroidales bacterium]|nr:flippase-like domain-containing protein [Bacteroidales bacterium]MCF8344006.1 flippase-like domain-containing protein [Bacteroidales bacterium]MCF8349726.1 flippase-like domain-containing protein [Bacteroidales bacterium]MCF8376673.1 flippase-like domain-containing protein [Bacteroidales bacterium]MCF8401756.1 flippase-like domain-containing protein [Bacteroidales bacterium]
MKKQLLKYGKLLLKLLITVTALYIVFRKIELHQVLELYSKSNVWLLLLGLAFFVFGQWISAFRLTNYLRQVEVHISNPSNFRLYLLGMFYNLFLPGGIGGDGYKIYIFNKTFKVRVRRLFWAILLDRVSGMLALVCLGIFLSMFIQGFGIYRYFVWLLFPAALLVHYLFIRYLFPHFVKILPVTVSQSFVIQTSQLITALMILFAFGNYDHLMQYLLLFLISSIVSTIPISVGGVGVREITFLYGAELMQLNINQSVALSFMFYLMTVVVSLSGIYYSFKPEKLRIKSHEAGA